MKKLLIATILGFCLLVLLGDYVCDKGDPCHIKALNEVADTGHKAFLSSYTHKHHVERRDSTEVNPKVWTD